MTPEMLEKLKKSLVLHEGKKNFPYFDTAEPPRITIGIGYDLTDRGLPDGWIEEQFLDDVNYFFQQLSSFPWFLQLNTDRQIALIDMCFMGFKKFLSFRKMIKAFERHDYQAAHDEALDSKWAFQVKGRAWTLAQVFLTGIYEL